MSRSGRFEGRVVLVTGAASGIGRATARRVAAEGATVLLADLAASCEQVAAGIRADGGRARSAVVDVADERSWAELHALAEELGGLDALHSNAYVHRPGGPADLDPADWRRVLDVNLGGLYLGARTFARMLGEHRGAIVATSSVHALFGLPGYTAYAASKGGITALVRQLAVELGPEIRVNAVLPGPIMSGAWDDTAETRERAGRTTVLGRMGEPEEVAAAVAFLASDEASFITGAALLVDGGWAVQKDSP